MLLPLPLSSCDDGCDDDCMRTRAKASWARIAFARSTTEVAKAVEEDDEEGMVVSIAARREEDDDADDDDVADRRQCCCACETTRNRIKHSNPTAVSPSPCAAGPASSSPCATGPASPCPFNAEPEGVLLLSSWPRMSLLLLLLLLLLVVMWLSWLGKGSDSCWSSLSKRGVGVGTVEEVAVGPVLSAWGEVFDDGAVVVVVVVVVAVVVVTTAGTEMDSVTGSANSKKRKVNISSTVPRAHTARARLKSWKGIDDKTDRRS